MRTDFTPSFGRLPSREEGLELHAMSSSNPTNGVRRKRSSTKPSGEYSLTLESIIGHTANHASALAVNPISGEIAYSAGCVTVVYSPTKHRQVRFFRASKGVSCVSYSKDGRYLAVGERGRDPGALVWDLNGGKIVGELKAHKYGISCMSFSPKPRAQGAPPLLATVGFRHDRMLILWDVVGGVRLAVSRIIHKVFAIDFSEEGDFFVTCGEQHIKFWPMTGGSVTKEGDELPILAPPSADLLQGVPVLTGAAASIVDSHRSATFVDVTCGRGRHRGSIYAVTSQGTLCVFSRSFLMEQWMTLETKTAYAVTCMGDYVVAACPDGLVRLFDAETLRYAATLPRPACLGSTLLPPSQQQYPAALGLRPLSASPPHLLACIYADHSLLIWDLADLASITIMRACLGHSACIWDAQFIPYTPNNTDNNNNNSERATTTARREQRRKKDGEVLLEGGAWEEEEEEKAAGRLEGGTLVTCSADDTIRFWSLGREVGPPLQTINMDDEEQGGGQPQRYGIDSSALNAALTSARAALSEGLPDTEIPSRPLSKYSPRCLAMHPRGHEIACGDKEGNLRVFDLLGPTNAPPRQLAFKPAHDAEVLTLDYAPGRQTGGGAGSDEDEGEERLELLATGSRDRLVHVFDPTRRYARVQTLENHSSSITAVRFTRDGRTLLSCGGDRALVMSSVQGRRVTRLKSVTVPSGTVYDIDVDPTNKYMITSGQDRRVNIWDVRTGKHIRSYRPEGPSGELYKVALDPSGMYAATCSFDKLVRIFDFFSGASIARVSGHSEVVTAVRFSPDGRRLVSVGGDGIIFVWRLPTDMTRAMHERLTELNAQRHAVPDPSCIRLTSSPPRSSSSSSSNEHRSAGGGPTTTPPSPQPYAQPHTGNEGHGQQQDVLLKMRTSDLPAWARREGRAASATDDTDSSRSNAVALQAMTTGGEAAAVPVVVQEEQNKWAARLQERGGGLEELFGQPIGGGGGDRRKLTVEDLNEAFLMRSGEMSSGSTSGSLVMEAAERAERDDQVLLMADDEDDDHGEAARAEHRLSLDDEDESGNAVPSSPDTVAIKAPKELLVAPVHTTDESGDDNEPGSSTRVGAALASTLTIKSPVVDELPRKAGAFNVNRSRDDGRLVLQIPRDDGKEGGHEEGGDSKASSSRGGDEASYQMRDEEAGRWLRQALRDASPVLAGGGGDDEAKATVRTSFSSTFFRGTRQPHEEDEEEEKEAEEKRPAAAKPVHMPDIPLPPPPPSALASRAQAPVIHPGGAVSVPPPSSAAAPPDVSRGGDEMPPRSQLEQEREALKVKLRRKRETVERVQQMQEDLRKMGILRANSSSAFADTDVSSPDKAAAPLPPPPPATNMPPPPPPDNQVVRTSSSKSASPPTSKQEGGAAPAIDLRASAKEVASLQQAALQGEDQGLGEDDFFDFSAAGRGDDNNNNNKATTAAVSQPKATNMPGPTSPDHDKVVVTHNASSPSAASKVDPAQAGSSEGASGSLKSLFSPSFLSAAAARGEASHAQKQQQQQQQQALASLPEPPPSAIMPPPSPPLQSARPADLVPPDMSQQHQEEGFMAAAPSLQTPIMPQSLDVYYSALRELDGAARRAMALYRELVDVDKSRSFASMPPPPSAPLLVVDTAGGAPPSSHSVGDVLDSFRSSFASLGDAAQAVAAEQQERHSSSSSSSYVFSSMMGNAGANAALDEGNQKEGDGGSSTRRGGIAGEGGSHGKQQQQEVVLPAALLERYSDMLMRMVERKVDDMMLSRSSSSELSASLAPPPMDMASSHITFPGQAHYQPPR